MKINCRKALELLSVSNQCIYVCVSIAGICLFLDTSSSSVDAHHCHKFSYGCPSYGYFSSAIHERKHKTLILNTAITNVKNRFVASYNCILPYKPNLYHNICKVFTSKEII